MAGDAFSSPIDAQLPLFPNPALQTENGLIYNEFQQIYIAIRRLQIGTTFGAVSGSAGGTGTTQGTATVLAGDINIINTTTAGGGVLLPAVGAGSQCSVKNFSASSVNIYPQSGGRIDNLAINAAFVLFAGASVLFFAYADTNYYSLKGA